MLKRFYAKKDEVPEALSAFYIEQDGGYVLQAEGHVDRAKVDEMRTENIALRKKVEELTAKFNGVDPEEFRRLAEEKRQLEESAQLKAGQFEKVLTTRLTAMKSEFDKQLAAVTTERDTAQKQLVTIQIDRGVLEAATKRGLRATAVPDITARARGALRLVDGSPVVFEADGQTVRRGSDGVAPMTLDEWVAQQAAEAPHLFETNAGGGAAGNGSGGAGGTLKNPFRKETWNLTEQMRLTEQDPVLAARLRAGGLKRDLTTDEHPAQARSRRDEARGAGHSSGDSGADGDHAGGGRAWGWPGRGVAGFVGAVRSLVFSNARRGRDASGFGQREGRAHACGPKESIMRHPCHFFREWQLIRWRRDALGEPRGPSGLPAAGTGFKGEIILVNERVSADSTRVDAANANLTVDSEQ